MLASHNDHIRWDKENRRNTLHNSWNCSFFSQSIIEKLWKPTRISLSIILVHSLFLIVSNTRIHLYICMCRITTQKKNGATCISESVFYEFQFSIYRWSCWFVVLFCPILDLNWVQHKRNNNEGKKQQLKKKY